MENGREKGWGGGAETGRHALGQRRAGGVCAFGGGEGGDGVKVGGGKRECVLHLPFES